ncbi:GNAT family N-acetyltransferase [Vibrio vulnificus]|uniref:GNAT family N-acetyltransferase n=1 Tax=Vibrio vulnificus TaxID=672 RepID=UPI00165D32D0|nr:GNAT family N-acetyltransferase [Vibrio vulnificus]EGR9009282.1 GNAT family N-acetyltransferase [Vibrio vulnificus]EHU9457418.1 GNAT family N-acetyltransferase [Vibrio vulnificus]HAS6191806.1 GNAT family N-acetyltransferase [Vibrio vulnificus]HAS8258980.1 GNAT family N-acetyltransferase [Vibrio vulnificus]
MVTCKKYSDNEKKIWDSFINSSKTPLFFFQRDFLEYHKHKFEDHSLMFFIGDELVGVLPASVHRHEEKCELRSHGGLTYGGLIFQPRLRGEIIGLVIKSLKEYCVSNKVQSLIYKSIPYIFHQLSSQEDLYFLFNEGMTSIYKRELSTIVYLNNKLKASKGRKALISKAKKNNLCIRTDSDFSKFSVLLNKVLKKHGVLPVHSEEELSYLKSKFPENIILKSIEIEGEMIAAALLFVFNDVVHTQYLATNDSGKEIGALDYLIEESIAEYRDNGFSYFSFGISTEENGKVLNNGLLSQKESFGGRSIAIDTYQVRYND